MAITELQMNELAARVNNVYLHMDDAFGGQCWDSAAWIQNYFGLPVINTGGNGRWPGWAGNMVDAFPQSAAIAAAYELVSPSEPAQPGDTLVWGDSYKEWYPKTHVATAIKDKLNGWILCLSQNSSSPRPDLPGYSPDASGPTIIQLLPKRGLIGILRPRSGSINYQGAVSAPVSEEDFMGGFIDAEQAEAIAERAATLVFEKLDNRLRINAVQAESIVQAATERTAAAVGVKAGGDLINAQQADDIARAAAQYNQERDAALYEGGK